MQLLMLTLIVDGATAAVLYLLLLIVVYLVVLTSVPFVAVDHRARVSQHYNSIRVLLL